jgi:hypothetical protein
MAMNNKIGKRGEKGVRPKETLLGRPITNKSQILITRNLGDGYFVVIDPGIIPDLEEQIDKLKKEIPNESKRKKSATSSGEAGNNL